MQVEVSVFDPATKCVICRNIPEGDRHIHAIGEGQHIACNSCVERVRNAALNQSAFCPEEGCHYDFNRPKNCGERVFRWLRSQTARLAICLNNTIRNPIAILMLSGGAALGVTAGFDTKRNMIILGACTLAAGAKLLYDLRRDVSSLAIPVLVGVATPYMGVFTAALSEDDGFNLFAAGVAITAGVAPMIEIYYRSRIAEEPTNCRYAIVVNSIASLLLFGSNLTQRASLDSAAKAAGCSFGFSSLIASYTWVRR